MSKQEQVDLMNGVWPPFAKQGSKLLAKLGPDALGVAGKISEEESQSIWDNLHGEFGEEVYEIMDSPGYNPMEDGFGIWVVYRTDEAEALAQKLAPSFGISIDPNNPNLMEPMGLRSNPTPFKVPDGVDPAKYQRTARSRTRYGALNDVMEQIYGGVFYDPEWVPEQGSSHSVKVKGDVQNPELRYGFPDEKRKTPPYEALAYHPDFQPDGKAWLGNVASTDVELVKRLAKELAPVIRMQESDNRYDVSSPNRFGAYQMSNTLWKTIGTEWNRTHHGISKAPEKTNDNQDAVAEYYIGKLITKYEGDLGAVLADYVAGAGNVRDHYMKGQDWRHKSWGEDHPSMMEYASELLRSWAHYKQTGEVIKGKKLPPLYEIREKENSNE